MAKSSQVKTPTGWSTTAGGWVKTGPTTWSAVDEIYVKTPTGWIKSSGQFPAQQPATRPATGTAPATGTTPVQQGYQQDYLSLIHI